MMIPLTLCPPRIFCMDDETADIFLKRARRHIVRTGIPFFDDFNAISNGNIVDIFGHSGCGKSEVALNCVARFIAQQGVVSSQDYNEPMEVYIIDIDQRLDIVRLHTLLAAYCQWESLSDVTGLENVHIIRCPEVVHLAIVLNSLHQKLESRGIPALLLLEGLQSAFLQGSFNATLRQALNHSLLSLRRLAHSKLIFCLTTRTLKSRKQTNGTVSNPNEFPRHIHQPTAWASMVTVGFCLESQESIGYNYASDSVLPSMHGNSHHSRFLCRQIYQRSPSTGLLQGKVKKYEFFITDKGIESQ